jgi:hypothetical protein
MANLYVAPGDALHIETCDVLHAGSVHNEGSIYGGGSIGLDWDKAIEGDTEGVTCSVLEGNVPELEPTFEVQSRTLIVSCEDVGASTYAIALDGEPAEPFADLVRRFVGLKPGSTHAVTVTATNSRGHAVTRSETITLKPFFTVYAVAQDVCIQPDATRGANSVFMARLVDKDAETPLVQTSVESIALTAWKHVRGKEREIVPGFECVDVPTDTVLPAVTASAFWDRDNGGINFIHVPDQRTNLIFPETGAYEVEYSFTLVDGNPINLTYEIFVY